MKVTIQKALPWLLATAATFAAALPVSDETNPVAAVDGDTSRPRPLPLCGTVYDEPCSCPSNTVFQNSTTTATIGANIKDVHAIMYSFFDIGTWIGDVPVSTKGNDLTVGASRTMALGDLRFVEKIVRIWDRPGRSFFIQHGQDNAPVVLKNATGSYYFDGYWDKLKVEADGPQRTQIWWHAFGCMTLPAGFGLFHIHGINETMKILESRKQLVGRSTPAVDKYYPAKWSGIGCC